MKLIQLTWNEYPPEYREVDSMLFGLSSYREEQVRKAEIILYSLPTVSGYFVGLLTDSNGFLCFEVFKAA